MDKLKYKTLNDSIFEIFLRERPGKAQKGGHHSSFFTSDNSDHIGSDKLEKTSSKFDFCFKSL